MTLRLTLRLDLDGRPTLGPGKVRLLELIAATGSISAAGRGMGMSYRKAWALVESLNALACGPVVAAHPGGAKGGGASLLPSGAELVALYRALEAGVPRSSAEELHRLHAMLTETQ